MSGKIAIFREDEAGQKWCPHTVASHTDPRARHWRQGDTPSEGGNTGPFIFGCMGEACTAFRWYETHIGSPDEGLTLNGETYGYCGLAGSPALRTNP